jgi:hypothetical protein
MADRAPKKRPTDASQLGKLIVDISTGEASETLACPIDNRDPAAVSLGRRGGLKGGKARAANLSPERRAEIARAAAAKRWDKKK